MGDFPPDSGSGSRCHHLAADFKLMPNGDGSDSSSSRLYTDIDPMFPCWGDATGGLLSPWVLMLLTGISCVCAAVVLLSRCRCDAPLHADSYSSHVPPEE